MDQRRLTIQHWSVKELGATNLAEQKHMKVIDPSIKSQEPPIWSLNGHARADSQNCDTKLSLWI
jgi:hypothetical protein